MSEENEVMQLLKKLLLLEDRDRAYQSEPKDAANIRSYQIRQLRRREITEQLKALASPKSAQP